MGTGDDYARELDRAIAIDTRSIDPYTLSDRNHYGETVKKSVGFLALTLVISMLFVGAAVATVGPDHPDTGSQPPSIVVDEEAGTVTIGLPLDGELPDCGVDGTEPPLQDDEVDGTDAAMTYGPGDCIEIPIDHPSGKTHHGAIVSTVARNLHPSMLDGIKKGQIMRWVAKHGRLPDDGTVGDGGEQPAGADKAAKANGNGKANGNKGGKKK